MVDVSELPEVQRKPRKPDVVSEREAAADGRPDVYSLPEKPLYNMGNRGRLRAVYEDRLLLALQRVHGLPRLDLAEPADGY